MASQVKRLEIRDARIFSRVRHKVERDVAYWAYPRCHGQKEVTILA